MLLYPELWNLCPRSLNPQSQGHRKDSKHLNGLLLLNPQLLFQVHALLKVEAFIFLFNLVFVFSVYLQVELLEEQQKRNRY